jgi:hypothetical protein
MLLVQYHILYWERTVLCVDPGYCKTDSSDREDAAHPEVGGRFIASVVLGGKDDQTGVVEGRDGIAPWETTEAYPTLIS